jgi:16S rRNA (guanine527-N7)-methyltransferase
VLGGKIREIRPVQLPGLTDKRAIITIEKVRSTPKQYPRKAGMAVKKPL